MRLLFLSPHYGTLGGTRLIIDALARAAREAGDEVAALVDGEAELAPAPRLRFYPFPERMRDVRRVGRFARKFPLTGVQLLAAVRRFAPDVVSVHCVRRFAPYPAMLRRLTQVPQVLSLQEAALPSATPENTGLFRLLVGAADVVAACSAEAAGYAERVGGARRVAIVPNGYDPAEFGPGPAFDHPRPYLLGVGRLEAQKGFDVLIEALAAVPGPDLLLAGDGSERARLAALALERGVEARVHLLGPTDRATTVALYRGAAAVVCPSRFEGLPLVCIEALAAARPVVASAVNGIPEVIRPGETGFLVPPDDPGALAGALARVLESPAEAGWLAARGRSLVEGVNAWPAVTGAYLALCRELARTSRTGVRAADLAQTRA